MGDPGGSTCHPKRVRHISILRPGFARRLHHPLARFRCQPAIPSRTPNPVILSGAASAPQSKDPEGAPPATTESQPVAANKVVDAQLDSRSNAAMQTLGLSAAPKPTDNLFKRLLWPEIANGYDVDLVSQQGFWVCFVVAVLSTIVLIATGQPLVGILVGATFLLGGMGVRQRSVAAATLIFVSYLLGRLTSLEATFLGLPDGGNPLAGIVATMLLFANVRATVLARRWKRAETPSDIGELPERTTTSFGDKLANVLPEKLWPTGKYVFYPLAVIVIGISILGMIGLPVMKARQAAAANQSTTFEVQQPQ